MSKEGQPGRDQTNAYSTTYSSEQGGANKESAGNAPRLSHEQMVKGFRDYIQQQQIDPKSPFYEPPALTIRRRLEQGEEDPGNTNEEKRHFFYKLKIAWNILAYEHLSPHSSAQILAVREVEEFYNHNPEPTIKLSDPQIRIIDALTDAVGIPHQRGQAEIEIPERLRDFIGWQLSKEFQERVAKAKEKK